MAQPGPATCLQEVLIEPSRGIRGHRGPGHPDQRHLGQSSTPPSMVGKDGAHNLPADTEKLRQMPDSWPMFEPRDFGWVVRAAIEDNEFWIRRPTNNRLRWG